MVLLLAALLMGVYGVSGCPNRPRPGCECDVRGVDFSEAWSGADYIALGSSVGSFRDDAGGIPCEIELPPEGGHATLRFHLENIPSGHVDFIACACITSGRGTRSASILINRAAQTVDVSAGVTLQGGQDASASIYVAYRVGNLEMRDRVDIRMRAAGSGGPTQLTFVGTASRSGGTSTTTFSPGTVKWITEEGPESVEIGVNPEEVEVTAGEVARYSISVPFTGAKFKLEGLPSGFRYLLVPSGSEGVYTLRIFTPLSAYGEFHMKISVEGQGKAGVHDLKLIVRKRATTSVHEGGPVTTSEEASSTTMQEIPPTGTSSPSGVVTTVVTTVVARPLPYLSLLPVAAVLLVIIAVLAIRRRSS